MPLTTQPAPAKFVGMIGLTAAPLVHGEEVAAATWKKGAFVQDDDAGLITPSASPVDGSAVTKRCIGLAMADATGTTSKDCLIALATPHTIYEATLDDANAGVVALAATHKWKVYPITKGSVNWYLDAQVVSDTGGGLVIGFKDPIGTNSGRVYFIVTSPARGGANAGSAQF